MPKAGKQSAGLLMFRLIAGDPEVFLVHPGGPLWAAKDGGAWGVPKGEYHTDEEPLAAAQREFNEETGFTATGPFLALDTVRQKSGKVVAVWAFEGDCDPTQLLSNTCTIEWPPRSKKRLVIPEIDRGAWFPLAGAGAFIREEQRPLLQRLQDRLNEQLVE